MSVRPLSDWIVVRRFPAQQRSALVELVGDHATSSIRTGEVLRVGPGRPHDSGVLEPMNVAVGDRVAFYRWHQEHRPGKNALVALQAASEEEGDVVMLRQADILFTFTGDVQVDI